MSFAQPASDPQNPHVFELNGRSISIQPFTGRWIPEVKAFNQRMLAGSLRPNLAFPEDPLLEYPREAGALLWQEAFLAVEGERVRGGYYFTHERYLVEGEPCWVPHCRHLISEVLIDKVYKGLGARLLADARQREPYLYAAGFGGAKRPAGQRFLADGWSHISIPFWFKVVHPARFLRNIAALRTTAMRKAVLDVAAATGVGWVGIKAAQGLRGWGTGRPSGYAAKPAPEFDSWADDIWEANRPLLQFAAVRDRATLNLRYPRDNPRLRRLVVVAGGRVAGWAVSVEKEMEQNAYFGDMRVGTIADCLAVPGHEPGVARAAAAELEAAGVDIIVSNQSFGPWRRALRGAGFLSGPSNYPLVVSPDLARKLEPLDSNLPKFHVNRGDGAGISQL